jgi:DNA-directed RNA polymerase II subunit RPB1
MPQDPESESELLNLAAVPYQIISPSNNSPIIGIYQDSMLGSYQFTRDNVHFTKSQAMNLLMMFNKVNVEELYNLEGKVSNFEILSQIMPKFSLKMKNKQFDDTKETYETTNNIVEIRNGKYIKGQIDKGILGSGTKGLIHRANNDYGNKSASNFIDDLQNIVTEYLKTSGFSVGISDLMSSKETQENIAQIILAKKIQIKNIIDQAQIGVFENNSGKTNEDEFETQINNILNQATAETSKVGLKELGKTNSFVVMVNAGSKGNELNISQMISCIGQQNVDGKRIPYGFDHRTLPHFNKYDDSPGARGFVESSYINGLSPQELFFHAMGGRIGLIDTAVKTSTTGYIQRKLIKGLEDLMINYDMTIRTNKNKIVQFAYGEDSIDTIKVENQELPVCSMNIEQIYEHYSFSDEQLKSGNLVQLFEDNILSKFKKQLPEFRETNKKYIDLILQQRKLIVKNIFGYKDEKTVRVPVAFHYIINNVAGQLNLDDPAKLVDITPLEAYKIIEDGYSQLEQIYYAPPTMLFKILYYYYLSPKSLLYKKFNKSALELLIETIILSYKRSIITPGEMVGLVAAQSLGETSTQMTLNTFHYAGVSSKSNVTRGVPRIDEILSLSSEPKNPSLTVYLKPEDETDKEKAYSTMYKLEHTKLSDVVKSSEIYFDPSDSQTLIQEDKVIMSQYIEFENLMNESLGCQQEDENSSKWIIRMVMDPEIMLQKNITMDDVSFAINGSYRDEVKCIYSDFNSDNLVFRIRMNNIVKGAKKIKVNPLDQTDQIYILKNFQDKLLQSIVLRGVESINKVILRKIKDNVVEDAGTYKKQEIWVLDTIGTNMMDVLGLDYIDSSRTFSNDIVEICNVLGIEAARQIIYNEMQEVIEYDGSSYINHHHYSILADRMASTYKMISIFRHGINNDNIGPIAKASFEETPEMFLKAAKHAELDTMRGVSANVMCGQEGFYGTSAFQVILDMNEMGKLGNIQQDYEEDIDTDNMFTDVEDPSNSCSITKLTIQNNVSNIDANISLGNDDDDYNPFL